jgi:hypothetical protein
MRKSLTMLTLLLGLAGLWPGSARSVTVTLYYEASIGLMDENMALLEDGCIVQLIYSPDTTIDPPSVYNGRPSGDEVLWQTTYIGTGMEDDDTGRFISSFQFESSEWLPGYVYVRFFNAPTWDQVTYYGQSPVHQLSDSFPWIDLWDVTEGGLYLWTEYPFMIIPEPETWLTLLPGLALAAFIFRKKRKREAGSIG